MSKIVEAAGGVPYRIRSRRFSSVPATSAAAFSPVTSTRASADAVAPSAPSSLPSSSETFAASSSETPRTSLDVIANSRGADATPFDDIEVCLVHRPKYNDWSFPKGKLDADESHRHAAVREMGEETGLSVTLGPFIGEVEYPLGQEGKSGRNPKRERNTKHIMYWMATVVDQHDVKQLKNAFGPVQQADLGEIDNIAWVSLKKAHSMLSHSTDRDILALFVDRLEEGAHLAVPLAIVRHGKAQSRQNWNGPDADRPITPKGEAAAYALGKELACFNPVHLYSSPWMRCMQTMQMFAWQTGRELVTIDDITEAAFSVNPNGAWVKFVGKLDEAIDHHVGTAICMHRPVIGGMFERLRTLCATPTIAKQLPTTSPFMPTGSAVVLFIVPSDDGPKIVDIQKVAPIVY